MLCSTLAVFPVPDMKITADFYTKNLGFHCVEYTNSLEPHMCLYRDDIEIILTDSKGKRVISNHELYGYGYDAYIIADNQEELQKEFETKNLKIVKKLSETDYANKELVLEDINGRWLGFGMKMCKKIE